MVEPATASTPIPLHKGGIFLCDTLPPMRSFLAQPYPFDEDPKRRLVVCGSIGLFVLFFLAVLQPFGFDILSPATRWLHAALFGAVTFVVSFLFQIILTRLLPGVFAEEGWRSWKEIAFLLVTTCVIGGANYGLMTLLYEPDNAAAGFWKAQVMTLEVGLFPVVAVVFAKQLRMYRRFAAEAAAVTEDIHEEEPLPTASSVSPQQLILLRGEGQKEELSVEADALLFIASADNYVSINFQEGGKLKAVLLRSSLKRVEEQLAGQEAFFRCHRMYLVNLQKVETVSGNAQGLKLHLSGSETPIPVSRSLTEAVKLRLHNLSHSPQLA